MKFSERIFGRRLRTDEEHEETLGILAAVSVLGLDAIASASYGPEAALTALLPAGGQASAAMVPIILLIGLVLLAVSLSYYQSISAYTGGGGSYIIAQDNLSQGAGLLAAAALSIDYILNVAVAISAGVGALVSALPACLPYTLPLCLAVLLLLTLVNLRGLRSTGFAFLLPTYLFVLTVGGAVAIGFFHPSAPPTAMVGSVFSGRVSMWLWLRAFSSGCSALTGVEAVSNAVPVFKEPKVRHARVTLTIIVTVLLILLLGMANVIFSRHIMASPPNAPGFQSVVAKIAASTYGHGALYYTTLVGTIAVLALSANTSFTAFPRLCRLLAIDGYLPAEFRRRGSRLVYTWGILFLAGISGALLIAFRGVTDRLIPLFAIGAFLAFSTAQVGMTRYWQKQGKTAKMAVNGLGALATILTLLVLIVLKFREGAWITVLAIPALIAVFVFISRYLRRLDAETAASGPLDLSGLEEPIVLLPIKRLDRVARKALRNAMCFARDIHVLHIRSEEEPEATLAKSWQTDVSTPARNAGRTPPNLVTITSAYREFFEPLIEYARKVIATNPDRPIAVWVPELTERRWYTFLLRHRANRLKGMLALQGMPQIIIVNRPWYARDGDRPVEKE